VTRTTHEERQFFYLFFSFFFNELFFCTKQKQKQKQNKTKQTENKQHPDPSWLVGRLSK